MMKTTDKLAALRERMKRHKLAAYLVPSTDAHQSEYVPECWQRRAWLSGFSGSAGDVVVTRDDAGLWTDGRYFLQAAEQLRGTGIRLFKMGEPGVPTLNGYLSRTLGKGDRLGADPRVLSLTRAQGVEQALAACGAKLALLERNLVDALWKDQPSMPSAPIELLPRRFAGESVASKLRRLRKAMTKREADALVVSSLDAIAWLFNIRGRDVDYNPVAVSYALVAHDRAELFIAPGKVAPSVARKLAPRVTIRPYDEIKGALGKLSQKKARVWVDADTTNRWIIRLLNGCRRVTDPSPVATMKAKKNATEIAGMRAAHVRDGVAMVRFLRWLEQAVPNGGVTELGAEAELERFRAEGEHFQGLSFRTISAYGAHGAIVHYAAEQQTAAALRPRGIYLIDSGGQYLDGTTDITRTVLLGGRPSREQKARFTGVLKGHIALAMARFPAGVRGLRLDTLARMHLWQAGLDYNHGTGHGVGAFLSVHEGPQRISPTRCTGVPLEAGNVLSNEPGYYRPGRYGIRIENLVLVQPDEVHSRPEKPWLRFETITQCPIDTRLVEPRLLTTAERRWLNAHHRGVKRTLTPLLDEPADRRWLGRACRAI